MIFLYGGFWRQSYIRPMYIDPADNIYSYDDIYNRDE